MKAWASFTKFGQTRLVPVVTFTRGKQDDDPRHRWDTDLWVERPEDYYSLMSDDLKLKVVRVVSREDWLAAETSTDMEDGCEVGAWRRSLSRGSC